MDIVTLALAKKFTKDTAIGLGAVKGASCVIDSIVPAVNPTDSREGYTINFSWTGTDGTVQTDSLSVYDGNTPDETAIEQALTEYFKKHKIDTSTDTTLKKSGVAADAKAVGDVLAEFKTKYDLINAENIKKVTYADNKLEFFKDTSSGATVAFSFDLPKEQFLDQAKTTFVDNFTWNAETYPGSTDPSLNGKPVLVLAIKGDGTKVTYSFVALDKLVIDYATVADVDSIFA